MATTNTRKSTKRFDPVDSLPAGLAIDPMETVDPVDTTEFPFGGNHNRRRHNGFERSGPYGETGG